MAKEGDNAVVFEDAGLRLFEPVLNFVGLMS